MTRSTWSLAVLLFVVGCGSVEQAPEHELAAPMRVLPPPSALIVDDSFSLEARVQIANAADAWCAFEPSMCLSITVGPVELSQIDTVIRMPPSAGCPELGQDSGDTGQIKIFVGCDLDYNKISEQLVAEHEIAHRFGALHVPEDDNLMTGTGPQHMSRCITEVDLIEVCTRHDCSAPRFDLVCSPAQAAASNPFSLGSSLP